LNGARDTCCDVFGNDIGDEGLDLLTVFERIE